MNLQSPGSDWSRLLRATSVCTYSASARRTATGLLVSIVVLLKSGTAFDAAYANWCVRLVAVSFAFEIRRCSICEIYRIENAVTITVTMRVMTNTMMVFRRNMQGQETV